MGGGQSRGGAEAAALSVQMERGKSLPEKEPGQTRAEDRALGPQHQRPGTEGEPRRSREQEKQENRGEQRGVRASRRRKAASDQRGSLQVRGGQGADCRAWQQRPQVTWNEHLGRQWRQKLKGMG